jgi:tape measure domain-containing protein
MANLGDLVVRIVGDNSQFDKSIDASQKKYDNFAKSLQSTGKKLTAFVTAPLLGIGIAAVKSAADMEMQAAAFETMLGSAQKAQILLTDLKDLAARTPFQLTDLADASKTLLTFGYDADKLLPTLQQLGDVAGGNAARFQSLTLAFAQVQSTGRLMGQDLNQMINAGFNPLKIIADETGLSMAELKKQMEAGAISADMVSEAFGTATSEGGLFFNGMALGAATLTGKWSTLMDALSEVGRSMASVLLPTIKSIIETLTKWAEKFSALDDGTKKIILTVVAVAAAIGPLMLVIGKLIPVIIALNAAILANPMVALATAAALVTAAIVGYVAIAKPATKVQQDLARVTKELQKEVVDADVAVQNFTTSLVENATAIPDRFKGVINALTGVAPVVVELTEAQKRYVTATKDVATGLEEVHQQELLAIKTGEEYDAQKERRAVILGEINKLIDEGYKVENGNIQGLIKLYPEILAAEDAIIERSKSKIAHTAQIMEQQAELRAAEEEAAAKRLEEEALLTEAIVARAQAETDAAAASLEQWRTESENTADYYSFLTELQNEDDAKREELHQKELARMEAERTRRIAIALDIVNTLEAFSNQIFENELANEELTDKERRKLLRQQAISKKAFALFDAGVNTARAIVSALAEGGIIGPILATLAGIAGGLQIAAIAATPIPALAKGGIVMPQQGGVTATVAEAGQPEVVFPLDRLESFLSQRPDGGGSGSDTPIHLQVMVDSRPILDQVFAATRNRTVLIDAGAVVGG